MAPFAYLLSIYIVIARSNRKCELYMLASIRYTVYHKSTGYVQSPELQSFRGVVHLFADGVERHRPARIPLLYDAGRASGRL